MSATNSRYAVVYALAAVLLWSTVASAFKLGLTVLAPVQLLWLGSGVSAVFFLLVQGWRRTPLPTLTEGRRAVLLGVLNPALYYLVLFEAYNRLPAQIAQPLNYTWAITLAVLAIPVLKQRLSRRRLAGILVSYAGVVVLLTQGGETVGALDPVGIGLALGSTVLWAGYWLMNTRATGDPLWLLTIGFCTGWLLLTPLCVWTTGLPAFTAEHVAYGLWVGLVEMGVTFLLWQQALRRARSAAAIGQLIFLSPFLSLLLIERWVGEAVSPASWLALAIIVAGLVLGGGETGSQTREP